MRQRLALIGEQQVDLAGAGLLPPQREANARARDGVGILPALQRVAGAAPGEAPLCRNSTLKRPVETVTPIRRVISPASRGKVHTAVPPGSARIVVAQASAAAPRVPGRPERGRARSPSAPRRRYQTRHVRTVSARTPSRRPIAVAVSPSSDQSTARARSASRRIGERANASSAKRPSAASFSSQCRPMTHRKHHQNLLLMKTWANFSNPA
jgi:hypothetical protein